MGFNRDKFREKVESNKNKETTSKQQVQSDPIKQNLSGSFDERLKDTVGIGAPQHDLIVTPQSLKREETALSERSDELLKKQAEGTLTKEEADAFGASLEKYAGNADYLSKTQADDFSKKLTGSERRQIVSGMNAIGKSSVLLPAVPGVGTQQTAVSGTVKGQGASAPAGAWWSKQSMSTAKDVKDERQALSQTFATLRDKYMSGQATQDDFDAFTRRQVAFSKEAPSVFESELAERKSALEKNAGSFDAFENGEITGISQGSVSQLYENTYRAFLSGEADEASLDALAAAVLQFDGKYKAAVLAGTYVNEANAERDELRSDYDFWKGKSAILLRTKGSDSAEYKDAVARRDAAHEVYMNASMRADNERKIYDEYKEKDAYDALMREYAYATGAQDFEKMSRYRSTANGKTPEYNAFTQSYSETGFDDLTYEYVNKIDDAINIRAAYENANGLAIAGADNGYILEMNDDEVALYNYLYATEGKESANAFLNRLKGVLNKRSRQSMEYDFSAYAKEHPVSASTFSVLTSPLKGVSYIGQAADYLEDGKIDQNAGYNK
ncbi:MAG: hypothetical protein ACI4RV_06400, partial [Eubacteriales bacterium]